MMTATYFHAPMETHMKKTDSDQETTPKTAPKPRPAKKEAASVAAPTPNTPLWNSSAYGDTITLSGARKLSDSRVAPLIAIARGYTTVEGAASSDFVKTRMHIDSRSRGARQFKMMFAGEGDVLAMPWYSLSAVSNFSTITRQEDNETLVDWERRLEKTNPLRHSIFQFRPSNPYAPEGGKPIKYAFLADSGAVIDAHPSLPHGWFDNSSDIFITEGIIKADSALTEMLIDAGVSAETLSETPTHEEANAKLATLLSEVPTDRRVLILAIAGVTNWRNKPEWTDLALRERKVYLAFDGDVKTNPKVFKQARLLWEYLEQKHAEPQLVDLQDASMSAVANNGEAKMLGVDDYFAGGYGDWNDLLTTSSRELPDAPAETRDAATIGAFRISPDGRKLQVGTKSTDEYSETDAYWADAPGHAIGGRVVRKITQRKPTDTEKEKGKILPTDERNADIDVEIEVAFTGRAGEERTAIVSGPATMLAEHPADWHKQKVGAEIPSELLLSPEWPPPKYGKEWVQAIKGNKPDDIEDETIWNTMGWVPTSVGGSCAYIAGDIVIAGTLEERKSTRVGVGENNLPGSTQFGVIDGFRYVESDETRTDERPKAEYDAEVKQIINQVFDTLIVRGPWVNPAHAAVTLAAGVRPVAAKRCINTVYALGEPGSGKTWTAGQIMAFWQSRPGAWSKDNLPGSAKDTTAAIEKGVSATMMWAIDDWAPSPDPRKATDDESKMGDIVRSVFNGTGKRRMNANMDSRSTLDPVAMLLITAENELTVSSARERTVPIVFQKGALDGKDAKGRLIGLDRVNTMNTVEGTSSKLTAALLHDIIDRVRTTYDNDWSMMIAWEKEELQHLTDFARRVSEDLGIPANLAQRQIEMAVDMCLGLMHLNMLTLRLKMNKVSEQIVDPAFRMSAAPIRKDTLVYRVMALVLDTYRRKDNTRPGQVWITAVRDMLQAKTGHFSNGERSDHAPFEGSNQVALNDLVGWGLPHGGGPMEPKGAHLGWVFRDPKSGEPFFLIHPENAFKEAKRQYPANIQHGSNKETYVQNVISDSTLISSLLENGKNSISVNRTSSGTKRGLPLAWGAIVEGIAVSEVKISSNRKNEED